jgi:hypothetical protein
MLVVVVLVFQQRMFGVFLVQITLRINAGVVYDGGLSWQGMQTKQV